MGRSGSRGRVLLGPVPPRHDSFHPPRTRAGLKLAFPLAVFAVGRGGRAAARLVRQRWAFLGVALLAQPWARIPLGTPFRTTRGLVPALVTAAR